jgi:hypothetical protein
VLKRNDDFSLTALPEIESSLDFDRIEGLYLHEASSAVNSPAVNNLAVIGTSSSFFSFPQFSNSILVPTRNTFSVSIFDLENPAEAQQTHAYEIEGGLLATRRIDNDLYLVSRYVPQIDGLIPFANTQSERLENYKLISQTPIADLMPKLYRDDQSISLNNAADCYIPEQASSRDGYAQLVTVSKIDLNAPDNIQSVCMSVNVHNLYMSANNLYLMGELEGQQTQIHKLDLSEFEYVASGQVEGSLQGRANALFKLSESNERLRVVTTKFEQGEPIHKLSILAT